jgi:tRNA(Ile)-lysidine synthase
VALHVHHGLRAEADLWCEAVRDHVAARPGVGFASMRLTGKPAAGESVEAWARAGRYTALARMANATGSDLVLLAHHRRDQAETFLLQALRGAGAAGLAAMPRLAVRAGITWARPWLDVPREAILDYAARHGLVGADDPSNRDRRFARSRLRGDVWPALVAAFPDAETTLAAAARRVATARRAADKRAETLLATLVGGDGSFDLGAWRRLDDTASRALALHAWLGRTLDITPPATLVERVLREADGRGKRWPAPGGTLVSRRGRLGFEPALTP